MLIILNCTLIKNKVKKVYNGIFSNTISGLCIENNQNEYNLVSEFKKFYVNKTINMIIIHKTKTILNKTGVLHYVGRHFFIDEININKLLYPLYSYEIIEIKIEERG